MCVKPCKGLGGFDTRNTDVNRRSYMADLEPGVIFFYFILCYVQNLCWIESHLKTVDL